MYAPWNLHYQHVRMHSIHGFYQGLGPASRAAPIRYVAVYSFFLEGLKPPRSALRNFIDKAAQGHLVGDVFDDAATGQGLRQLFPAGREFARAIPEAISSADRTDAGTAPLSALLNWESALNQRCRPMGFASTTSTILRFPACLHRSSGPSGEHNDCGRRERQRGIRESSAKASAASGSRRSRRRYPGGVSAKKRTRTGGSLAGKPDGLPVPDQLRRSRPGASSHQQHRSHQENLTPADVPVAA